MFLQIYTIVFAQIRIHQTSAPRRAGAHAHKLVIHERELVHFVWSLLNSKKLRKKIAVVWKNLPMGGLLDTQTYPWVNLSILETTLGYVFPDNHFGLSAIYIRHAAALVIGKTCYCCCNNC